MKTLFLITFSLLLMLLDSCQKDTHSNFITGKWVRLDHQSDTILFGYKSFDNWFELRRGSKLINGNVEKIVPNGFYEYKIYKDSIMIQSIFSEIAEGPKYYYSVKGNEIELGNFIDSINSTIKFEKMK
jgi:hypothetical protein